MSEVRNVPRLRFPEFHGNWSLIDIKDVFSILNGYAFSSSDSQEKGVKWVKIADVGVGKMVHKNVSYLPESFLSNHKKFILKKGDFVVALTRPILSGKLKISPIDDYYHNSLLNQRVGKIETKNESVFIYNLLRTNRLINTIENNINGSEPPNLSPSTLNGIKVDIPSLPEQQKIADFLTAVDKRIELLEKKKNLLETYKKGVMKKIFNQEIRFKDDNGNDFPVWREMKLGNVLTEYISKTKVNNQHDVLSSTIEKIYRQSEYFNHQVASKDNTGYKVLKLNQLVFSPQNIWMGNINVNTEFEKGIVSPSYKIYDFKPGYDYMYFKDFLKQPKMLFEYTQSSEQGASVVRRNLNLKLFLSIPIKVPSLDEQIKISNFLSSIDNQIERLDTQIDKSKSWKKGLLQKMFV